MGTELQSRRDGRRSSVQEEGLDSARSVRGRGHPGVGTDADRWVTGPESLRVFSSICFNFLSEVGSKW